MLSDTMHKALLAQINKEIFSAYQYAAMANYFESENLKGFAHWMRSQSDEELIHARKIVDYLNNRGARVTYSTIEAPKNEFDSTIAAFEAALAAEQFISDSINSLSTMAVKENDHATHAMLEWFVTEQVEEEAVVNDILQRLKLIDGAPGAMYMLDRELGSRAMPVVE